MPGKVSVIEDEWLGFGVKSCHLCENSWRFCQHRESVSVFCNRAADCPS